MLMVNAVVLRAEWDAGNSTSSGFTATAEICGGVLSATATASVTPGTDPARPTATTIRHLVAVLRNGWPPCASTTPVLCLHNICPRLGSAFGAPGQDR